MFTVESLQVEVHTLHVQEVLDEEEEAEAEEDKEEEDEEDEEDQEDEEDESEEEDESVLIGTKRSCSRIVQIIIYLSKSFPSQVPVTDNSST